MRERYHLKDQLVKKPHVHTLTNVKRKFYARMTRGCPFEVRRRQPLLQPEIRGGKRSQRWAWSVAGEGKWPRASDPSSSPGSIGHGNDT